MFDPALTPQQREEWNRRKIELFLFEEILGAQRLVEGTRCMHVCFGQAYPNELPIAQVEDPWAWARYSTGPRFSVDHEEMCLVEAMLEVRRLHWIYLEALCREAGFKMRRLNARSFLALLRAPIKIRAFAAQTTWMRAREERRI